MKKGRLPALFATGLMLLFGACENQNMSEFTVEQEAEPQLKATYALNNWLGSLSDNINLAEISIPGSHDAGAMYEPWAGTAKCQDLNIGEQLDAGIRFLDIRCRHLEDAFTIHHGSIYQHLNFDDVLWYCWNFLNNHPTECIVMSVKEEYDASDNTETFEETFDKYVAKNAGGWYLGASIPNLGAVRGKIVLFRRFSASTQKGINATNWKDNTTFDIYNGNEHLKVQDIYKVSDVDDKWNAVSSLLNEAKNGASSTLYVNFSSGYKPLFFGIPSITDVSNKINPSLSEYFTSNISGRFGILPMDFVNEDRSALIIRTNF